MSLLPWRALAFAALASLGGCGGSNEITEFPAGLDSLEPNIAPAPTPTAADRYPETIAFDRGATADYEFVHGRGYVHAPISAVFTAFRDPAVTADRRRVSAYTSTIDVEPAYPYSYRVHNIVNDIVTIEFDITWRLGPTAGTAESPTSFGARYQKTFGSSFIDVLAGSVVARVVDSNTTEVELIRHLRATAQNADDAEQTVRDLFTSVVASAHGQPLPTY